MGLLWNSGLNMLFLIIYGHIQLFMSMSVYTYDRTSYVMLMHNHFDVFRISRVTKRNVKRYKL